MLEKLLNGTENWTYLLINDSIRVNGRTLLFSFVNEYLKRQYEVHYISFDVFVHDIKDAFPPSENRLHWHDGCSHRNYAKDKNLQSLTPESNLADYFNNINKEENVLFVIDSLSTLLLHQDVRNVCKMLHSLQCLWENRKDINVKIISLCHPQIHDEEVLKLAEYLFTTVVNLRIDQNSKTLSCEIKHRRSNGKFLQEEESFKMDNYNVLDVKKMEPKKNSKTLISENTESDPTAGLSFKLTLDDREKDARSKLVLPYTKVAAEQSKEDGEIIYQADANDDFDEEDPDDDLNI